MFLHFEYFHFAFWLNLLKNGGNVKYLNGIHFYYRIKSKGESRNLSLAHKHHDELRKQIWINHNDLYSRIYTSPYYSHEYRTIAESREYKIGKLIMSSIHFILNLPSSLFLSK